MISRRDSPPGRRHFRLGPLGLIADTGEEFDRIQSWLPQASLPTEHAPAAAVWISKMQPPKEVIGKPMFDADGIAVWIDEDHDRATAIGMTAHAEIDLREKSSSICSRSRCGCCSAAPAACSLMHQRSSNLMAARGLFLARRKRGRHSRAVSCSTAVSS